MDKTKLTIVQANDLIEASYNLFIDELRVINLALTKVKSWEPNIDEIRIDVTEFIHVYSLQRDNRVYSKLKAAVKSIMRSPIKIPIDGKIREIAWLEMNEYYKDDGSYVLIKFSRAVEPYLFKIKAHFTSVDLENIARLNTPFSFRLYQWLMQAKKLNKNKEGGAVKVELPVEWMKEKTGLEANYSDWRNFKQKVLSPAIEKINTHTNISILPPKPMRTGKKITSAVFIYALEEAVFTKPARPRLQRRPKVTKGSHEEGVWMRANFNILHEYRKALKAYDPNEKMSLPDLRKYAEYAKIVNPDLAQKLRHEIAERSAP